MFTAINKSNLSSYGTQMLCAAINFRWQNSNSTKALPVTASENTK